ncbi:MAG: protein kinase [Verrucomicrobia subdivision 3 bacterium]|nr:protein kinase [Limisphaerales bacterium]
MPATRKCRGCGADVPANAPFGHCPSCLLELGFGPLPEGVEATRPPAGGGRAFADYELFEQIGRGGMGVIYKARQVTLKRLVALKMVKAGEFASPTLIQRFHLEAEAAANLHHPNIVPIYETGEHDGQHFFSMELIDGAGLDRYITSTGFCFNGKSGDKPSLRACQEQIARIMAKVARAVDYAHQHGVLHRDLKPSNVILDGRGEPHLTDFGVAKVIGHEGSSLTASGAIMGTPSYMAPEQAAGQSKRITIAADIYSLGAILYEMLTGHVPFRAETPVQTLKQVIEEEPKHPSTFKEGLDRDLATICMKCLEKEPPRRYPSAAALAEDLDRFQRREPIAARPAGTAGKVWRWARRNPKVAALSAAVAVLLVVSGVAVTIAAMLLNDRVHILTQQLGVHRQVMSGLAALDTDPTEPYFDISSATRRELTGEPRFSAGVKLKFGTYRYAHPTNMLDGFSPILAALEEYLSKQIGRRVAIDIRVFQTYQRTHEALASNYLHFGRIGPASYIKLSDKGDASLLAAQFGSKPVTLAIFTLKDSDIARRFLEKTNTPLTELLRNQSFAFGDTNSTTGNFVAKWFLVVSNGIYASDLGTKKHLKSHNEVCQAVRAGEFDVGAANLNYVVRYPDLQVLATYALQEDVGRCWVASKALDTNMAKHIQRFFLELSDPRIFEALTQLDGEVNHFKTMSDESLKPLRNIIHQEATFEAGRK